MPETPQLPLRDIIAPPEPHWWPPAPGWWALFALVTLLLLWLAFRALRRLRNRPESLQSAALRELNALAQENRLDAVCFAEQLSALLKRVAIARYGEQHPAGLSGEAWLAFLDQHSPKEPFSQLGGESLLDAQYRAVAEIDREKLLDAAREWIRGAA